MDEKHIFEFFMLGESSGLKGIDRTDRFYKFSKHISLVLNKNKGMFMNLDYGIIGNCRTAALISDKASIDWLCFPRFDSTSLFAKLLDKKKGGNFEIYPVGEYRISQSYIDKTNILKTTFRSDDAEFEVVDYFPYYEENNTIKKESELHRIIFVRKGNPEIVVRIQPRFEYGRYNPEEILIEKNKIFIKHKNEKIFIYTDMDKKKIIKSESIILKNDAFITLAYNTMRESINIKQVKSELDKTRSYWEEWINTANIPKVYHKYIERSALTLKLLTYDDTGAIIAAPTTSIPEEVGGVKNWDYRYCWIRDASFTVLALLRIGKREVAHEFIKWISRVYAECGINFQPVFKVNGERDLTERTLDYLEGYEDSKPVRIGNSAYKQRQVDIFGEVLDALYTFYVKYNSEHEIKSGEWRIIYGLVESAINEWYKKDRSIWEFRKIKQHFVFSKVLSWVAVDKGIQLAGIFGKKDIIKGWKREANKIKKDIMEKGFDKELNSFVQYYGSKRIDASLLLIPYFGFIEYDDPKMVGTISMVKKRLFKKGFLKRYLNKGDFGVPNNSFIACTFWLIESLYLSGKRKEAIHLFENVLKHTNRLGLLSEDINQNTGELIGNFPQSYSHIALINTAIILFGDKS